jgi:chromosome segregation protein
MKIKRIELSGFRGVKNKITVPLGPGFTIITGRNGSGKSSICDALEYALTHQLTRFSPADVEGGERIDDYIWWRDGSRPSGRRVEVVFQLDDGTGGRRIATPEKLTSTFDDRLFYETGSHPPDPVGLLTRTLLIRDESIVKFSTDLPEADRFELFYRAIGITDLVAIEKRANTLVQRLKSLREQFENEYRARRETVAHIISEISEARTLASQASTADVATTQKRLAILTEASPDTPLRDLIAKTNQVVARHKARVQALGGLSADLAQFAKWGEQLLRLEEQRDTA